MENNTEPTSEAPATTGAENPNASLTIDDLASSFMEKVEDQTQDQSTIDSTEESDQEVVDSAEDQDGNVLSHNDNDTEEDSEQESETEEVEGSEEPKGLQKAIKRINQLTARAKGAEEEVATLKQQIQSIQSQSQQPNNQSDAKPALDKINNIADLETLRKEALSAKKWALSNLGRGEVIEVDGKEYDDDDIRHILTEAEDYLTEGIPQRAQFLQQKQRWVADTISTFPWSEKGEGPEWELFIQIRDGVQYKPLLDGLPNGDFVAATLVEGINSVKARQNKSKAKPKTKAKTPPTDLADAVAPPAENKQVRREKKRQAILSKPIGSEKDLAQYLQL